MGTFLSPKTDDPPQHAQTSASALEVLAAVSRGPGANGQVTGSPARKSMDQPRMRSSIACARCRRSKIKCVNNGVNTTCKACAATGRDCIYPSPAQGERAVRREGSAGKAGDAGGANPEGQRQSKPRGKRGPITHYGASPLQSMRPLLDALDPNLLTPQVWLELVQPLPPFCAKTDPLLTYASVRNLANPLRCRFTVHTFAIIPETAPGDETCCHQPRFRLSKARLDE
jgi:hypothetical protein